MPPKKAALEQIANARKEVEQLRREHGVQRRPMSETLAEMVKYVSDNQGTDQLLRKTHIEVVKEEENPLIKDEPMCRVF